MSKIKLKSELKKLPGEEIVKAASKISTPLGVPCFLPSVEIYGKYLINFPSSASANVLWWFSFIPSVYWNLKLLMSYDESKN